MPAKANAKANVPTAIITLYIFTFKYLIKINDIKYHKVKFKNITKNNSNSINSLMLLLPKKLNSELEKGDP